MGWIVGVLIAIGIFLFVGGFATRGKPQTKRYGFVTLLAVLLALACFGCGGIARWMAGNDMRTAKQRLDAAEESVDKARADLDAYDPSDTSPRYIGNQQVSERTYLEEQLYQQQSLLSGVRRDVDSHLTPDYVPSYGFLIAGAVLLLLTPLTKTTRSQDMYAGAAAAVFTAGAIQSSRGHWTNRP